MNQDRGADVFGVSVHVVTDAISHGAVEVQRIFHFEDVLRVAVGEAGVGIVDGNAFGEGEAIVFAYGPDLDALSAIVERVVSASGLAPGSWRIERHLVGEATDTLGDQDETNVGTVPAVLVRGASHPPSWHELNWYELEDIDGSAESETRRHFFCLDPAPRRRPHVQISRQPAGSTPIICIREPISAPSGWWDPWTVDAVHESHVSLYLPSWLLDAPTSWIMDVAGAQEMMSSNDVGAARRRADQNLFDRAPPLLDALRELGPNSGSIVWWLDDRPVDVEEFSTGDELAMILQRESVATKPRQHLISGLFDADQGQLW